MFNFGWGELVLISIVALIAIGPKELPTVLRTIGQALGKVRRMANEFQGQFQEALREADIADLKKHADDIKTSFDSSVGDMTNFDPLADTQKEIEKGFDLATPAGDTPAELPAPEAKTEKAPDVQGATAQAAATPLPEIDVPLPDAPAAVTEKDFAAVEPAPAEKPKSPDESAGKSVPKSAPKKGLKKSTETSAKESSKQSED